VGDYLERLGVKHGRLAFLTLGALDATGTNETGWKEDRRVDIELKKA
jgi:outer membrane protein OmpA-like peptidoglycan-associated protein